MFYSLLVNIYKYFVYLPDDLKYFLQFYLHFQVSVLKENSCLGSAIAMCLSLPPPPLSYEI